MVMSASSRRCGANDVARRGPFHRGVHVQDFTSPVDLAIGVSVYLLLGGKVRRLEDILVDTERLRPTSADLV